MAPEQAEPHPISIAGSPAWQIESLSDIASGLQFSNDGSLVIVNEERESQLSKQFQDLTQTFVPARALYGGFSAPCVVERSFLEAT